MNDCEPDTVEGAEPAASTVSREQLAHVFPAEAPPNSVGRFRELAVLADGGLSTVFSGYDPDHDEHVAIKLIKPQRATKTASARLLAEGRLLCRVRSPHVVALHEMSTHEGRPFLAMDLLRRGSLHARILRGVPSDPWSTARVIAGVCAGLSALHAASIIHGDVHPGNLLIARRTMEFAANEDSMTECSEAFELVTVEERIVVCDLDVAVDLLDPAPWQSCGTPRFRAPERAEPIAEISERTDVYGATAVLWSTVSASAPPLVDELVDAADALPSHWRRVMTTGMNGDPDRRFATMRDWSVAAIDALNVDLVRNGCEPLMSDSPNTC